MTYPLVQQLAAEGVRVASSCRVLGFTTQAFYQWSAAATLDLDQIANGVAAIDTADRARNEAEKVVAVVPGAEIEEFEIRSDSVLVVVRLSGDSFLPGFDIDGVGRHRAQAFDPFGP